MINIYLWKKVFNTDPPVIKNEIKEKDKIIIFLKESLTNIWPNLKLSNYKLDSEDIKTIKRLTIEKFKIINHF